MLVERIGFATIIVSKVDVVLAHGQNGRDEFVVEHLKEYVFARTKCLINNLTVRGPRAWAERAG
jgi:hypothetical protein